MIKSGKKIAIVLMAVAAMFIVVRSCHRRPADVRDPAGRQALRGASGIAHAANPLDHPRQRDSAINAGELVSFILEWTNPETGLVPTMISKSGHKNPFSDMSYAYAQAVVHQNFVLAGLLDRSSNTAELFRSRGETREIPNGFSVRTGLSEDPLITAGPNAYWGISFVKEYQLTGDEKWITAAGRRADFLLKLQTGDGGVRKSPFQGNPEYNAKSTEENLDCYALFSMLSRITKENKYKAAASNVLKWLAESGVYNKEAGYFTAGTSNDEVNPVYATDANALAIVILGPELLDSGGEMQFGGAGTSRRILDSLDAARVKVDYLHPSGAVVKGLEGFDYTDKFGRPGRKPVLSPEFTSQAVLAYLVMAKYAKEKGDAEYSAKLIEEAGRYLYDLGRMAARTGRSASLPYASEKGIRRFSFDNWLTPQAESDTSAMWASFPLAGYNPFSLEGFELRDALSGTAKWMGDQGEVIKPAKAVVIPETEKIISEAELIAQQEAAREESMRKPI
ncbi:MAG: glycoside hydrolase family 76 protein, partial [Dehalococcoidales bacterium]